MFQFLGSNLGVFLPVAVAVYGGAVSLRLKNHNAYLRLQWVAIALAAFFFVGYLAYFFGGGPVNVEEIKRLAQSTKGEISVISEIGSTEELARSAYLFEGVNRNMDRITSSAVKLENDIAFLIELIVLYLGIAFVFAITSFVLPVEEK